MTVAAPLVSQEFSLDRLVRLWELDHPGVVWRHDVDFLLDTAVQMAELEYAAGIRATYYILADAPDYDHMSDEFARGAGRILDCGHAFGSHVDLGLPRDSIVFDEDLTTACDDQAWSLRAWPVLGRVSLHTPPRDAVWRRIPGFDHALAPQWCGRYVSDSRGEFIHSPEAMLAGGGSMQINLHPCWWLLPQAERDNLRRKTMMKNGVGRATKATRP